MNIAGKLSLVVAVCVVAALAPGCAERRAESAFQEAVAGEKDRPAAEVRADLARIVASWPDTRAAEKARREMQWLADLEQSSRGGRQLLAADAVRADARAVELFRAAAGHYPERLEETAPRCLRSIPVDPWGRPVSYLRTPGGYKVFCYGADGAPGGSGDDTDIVVVDGREIHAGEVR